jgi:hypothetical protein
MTTPLDIVLAYYKAWTTHDFDQAMTYIADDIICHAPAGRLEGAEAFRAFMEPFSQILIEAELLGSSGDGTTVMLMYGTSTRPVPDAPGAELHTVHNGKITNLHIIFDRLPFDQARAAQSGSDRVPRDRQ